MSVIEQSIVYPRITIQFCTQCKWLLRAAYFAQELLSTFSTSLGEVSLIPSTGGTFIVTIYHKDETAEDGVKVSTLWNRKTDGGFPETKQLKQRVRDVIDPGRNLGHVDGKKAIKAPLEDLEKTSEGASEKSPTTASSSCIPKPKGEVCEDCQ